MKGIVLCAKKEKKEECFRHPEVPQRSEQTKSGKYNLGDFKDWIFMGPSDAFLKAEAPSLLCTG